MRNPMAVLVWLAVMMLAVYMCLVANTPVKAIMSYLLLLWSFSAVGYNLTRPRTKVT